MIQTSNVKVKASATRLPVMVECPLCYHRSEIKVKLETTKLVDGGTAEGACHRCGTTFTFEWARIPEEQEGG